MLPARPVMLMSEPSVAPNPFTPFNCSTFERTFEPVKPEASIVCPPLPVVSSANSKLFQRVRRPGFSSAAAAGLQPIGSSDEKIEIA